MARDEFLEEHRQTWRGFCKLVSFATAGVVVSLALLALVLL